MALIKCGECGKEVSDKAVSCPGCGAPIAGPSARENPPGDREEVLKEIGVQEVIVRDRVAVEFEILGRHFVKYFPVLVTVFAAFYIPYRIAMELGMGVDFDSMPDWIGFTSMGVAIATLIFGKFIRGRIGWAVAVVFVAWFILSPDFVSRGEQVKLDHDRMIRQLQSYGQSVRSCKQNPPLKEHLKEQCGEYEKIFLDLVAKSTDEQLSSICDKASFYRSLDPAVEAACTGGNL